ncbi:MAG: hypothetical protein KDI30_01400, partial [Pseudomonadales bacterium]|nr:hypothetical protein [Pseudomonadales bacterium]
NEANTETLKKILRYWRWRWLPAPAEAKALIPLAEQWMRNLSSADTPHDLDSLMHAPVLKQLRDVPFVMSLLQEESMLAEHAVLLVLRFQLSQALLSGAYHQGKGILNGKGQSLKHYWFAVSKVLVDKGYISKQDHLLEKQHVMEGVKQIKI